MFFFCSDHTEKDQRNTEKKNYDLHEWSMEPGEFDEKKTIEYWLNEYCPTFKKFSKAVEN